VEFIRSVLTLRGHALTNPSPAIHRSSKTATRPLDVAQAAVLPGWTRDAVRVVCERGELAHSRDHLNAYHIARRRLSLFLRKLTSAFSLGARFTLPG